MDNIKSINFFNEKEKYKKDVNILNLIVLGTILIMLLLDAIKVYKLNDLEIYVNESKKAIDNLDVSVSGEDYGKMCGLAALISVIAVLIPSGAIMRLQPKEILSKHD